MATLNCTAGMRKCEGNIDSLLANGRARGVLEADRDREHIRVAEMAMSLPPTKGKFTTSRLHPGK